MYLEYFEKCVIWNGDYDKKYTSNLVNTCKIYLLHFN